MAQLRGIEVPALVSANHVPIAVVDAAVALAREGQSVGAVKMRLLARRLGMSATSLYKYFDGRESLLRAALFRANAGLRARLEACLDGQSEDALCRWVECYASGDPHDPWLRDLFMLASAEDLPADHEAALVGFPSLVDAVARLGQAGAVVGVPPEVVARLLWSGASAILGMRADHAAQHNGDWRRAADAVVRGMIRLPGSVPIGIETSRGLHATVE